MACLALILAAHKVASLLFFSSISVAVNRSVVGSPNDIGNNNNNGLAVTNGLSMLGGSAAKACGPIVAGMLVKQSIQAFPSHAAAWVVYATLAVGGALLAYTTQFHLPPVPQEDNDKVVVTSTTGRTGTAMGMYEMVSLTEEEDTTTASHSDEDEDETSN